MAVQQGHDNGTRQRDRVLTMRTEGGLTLHGSIEQPRILDPVPQSVHGLAVWSEHEEHVNERVVRARVQQLLTSSVYIAYAQSYEGTS